MSTEENKCRHHHTKFLEKKQRIKLTSCQLRRKANQGVIVSTLKNHETNLVKQPNANQQHDNIFHRFRVAYPRRAGGKQI